MNKKTIKAVSRRILKTMMAVEKSLKILLETETDGIPDQQLDGLMIKVEQQLGRIMVNQNKLCCYKILQKSKCDIIVTVKLPYSCHKGQATGDWDYIRSEVLCG